MTPNDHEIFAKKCEADSDQDHIAAWPWRLSPGVSGRNRATLFWNRGSLRSWSWRVIFCQKEQALYPIVPYICDLWRLYHLDPSSTLHCPYIGSWLRQLRNAATAPKRGQQHAKPHADLSIPHMSLPNVFLPSHLNTFFKFPQPLRGSVLPFLSAESMRCPRHGCWSEWSTNGRLQSLLTRQRCSFGSSNAFRLEILESLQEKPARVPARSMTTPIPTAELPPRMRRSSKQRTVWLQQTGLFRFRVDTIMPKPARINQHPILKDSSAPPLPKSLMMCDHRGRRSAPPKNSSTPTIWDRSWRRKPAAFNAPTPVMKMQSHQCK